MDLDPQGWRIEWDPALLAPDLTAGTTLSYTTTVGPAPSVLDRRGQPILEQQVVTLVSLDATADPAAVAPLLATAAPTITAQSLAADVAAAAGKP